MALPVLDGNQSATTLSSVVTGGEHIVAHSVVSLGANAIANITSAVSGSVVSVSNFPASQSTTFGAVTGSVSVLNFPSTQTIAGTVTANTQTQYFDPVNQITLQRALISFIVNENDGESYPVDHANGLPISGTVTANVDAGSLISALDNFGQSYTTQIPVGIDQTGFGDVPISGTVTVGNSVTIGSLPAISGTVTVSAISTSVTARLVDSAGTAVSYAATGSAGTPSTDVISVQGVSGGTSLPISGTAGTLTTRFGSVTTANTAQISSAVTNASRKYLLIQNVTTSSNVITIGIGFTPTTTQGIQLTAGAGITFESSYIPTGAVYVLSSVTASPFTILEA